MLRHLRIDWEEQPDGSMRGSYTDPNDPDNWIDDPCVRCGKESHCNVCEGCQKYHHHGMVHLVSGGGPDALCKECGAVAVLEWEMNRANRRQAS
jgi:hypothetical protein